MTDLVKPVPRGISQFAYILESIICKKVHNPIVMSSLMGSILLSVAVKQYLTWSPYNSTENSGFLPDLLSNSMNLLFILRFPLQSETSLRLRPNKYVEAVLFACLNLAAVASLCLPAPAPSLMGRLFRALVSISVILPYVILGFNLAEMAWYRLKTPTEKNQESGEKGGLLGLIADANNSFLAIFMAQSFTAVNVNLPFYENAVLPVLYRYASYSLKFYLIYCFVLYEVVVVIYDITDIKSYAELYVPVSLETKKRSWSESLDKATSRLLMCLALFAMAFDSIMVGLECWHHGL